MENKFRVLIAACDTFRSGAVEQLRTHHRRLNALHPGKGNFPNVFLYEKGYGKDSAGVAMEAIKYGKELSALCIFSSYLFDHQMPLNITKAKAAMTSFHANDFGRLTKYLQGK